MSTHPQPLHRVSTAGAIAGRKLDFQGDRIREGFSRGSVPEGRKAILAVGLSYRSCLVGIPRCAFIREKRLNNIVLRTRTILWHEKRVQDLMRLATLLVAVTITLIGSHRAFAGSIIFDSDTPTELVGSFSASEDEYIELSTVFFRSLPRLDDDSDQALSAGRAPPFVYFGSLRSGVDDDPFFIEFAASSFSFSELLGAYANSPTGQRVVFRFFDLSESSGEEDGTFSGKFSFRLAPASVPDSGMTLPLLGLGLAGLLAIRRRP